MNVPLPLEPNTLSTETTATANLGAWPVVAVERERNVLVKLRPILQSLIGKAAR